MTIGTAQFYTKQTEYNKIIKQFVKWKPWQQEYFLCLFCGTLPINILNILVTDFEPLYHSGYLNHEEVTKNLTEKRVFEEANKRKSRRKVMPENRDHHIHVTEQEFRTKTIKDYILRPNPINVEVFQSKLHVTKLKNMFLVELQSLKDVYDSWEGYEYIKIIHLLLPYCSTEILNYFSSCVHKRVSDQEKEINLSDKILLHIFSFLTPKELCTVALVCMKWKNLAYESDVWKRYALKYDTQQVDLTEIQAYGGMTIWRPLFMELYQLSQRPHSFNKQMYLRFGSILKNFKIRKPDSIDEKPKSIKIVDVPLPVDVKVDTTGDQQVKTPDLTTFKTTLKKKGFGLRTGSFNPPKSKPQKVCILSDFKSERDDTSYNEYKIKPKAKAHSISGTDHKAVAKKLAHGDLMREKLSLSYGSCCQLDEMAYEEVHQEYVKPHSKKHVHFMRDIMGIKETTPAETVASVYPLLETKELCGHRFSVHVFQADLPRIISGDSAGYIRLWNAKTGLPIKRKRIHNGAVNALQFDGYKIITGGWDGVINVLHIATFEVLHTLHGHTDSVTAVIFNAKHVISSSRDKTIRVYDPKAPFTCTHVLSDHEAGVDHLDMDATVIMSSSSDLTIRLWCATNYILLRTIHCNTSIRHFSFINNLIIASTHCRKLLFIDRRKELPNHWIHTDQHITYLWSYKGRLWAGCQSGLIQEWDILYGVPIRTLNGHYGPINCLQGFRRRIISCSEDKTLKLWELGEYEPTTYSFERKE